MIEELHVAKAQCIVLEARAKHLDANRQGSVGHVSKDGILVATSLESPAISYKSAGHIAVFTIEVNHLEVGIFACEVTVEAIHGLAHGDSVLYGSLEVIGHSVGGEHGGIVGIVQVSITGIGAEHTIDLYFIDAVCQACEGLCHIHSGIPALGSMHLAALGTFMTGSYLAFPTVETILEGWIGQQHCHIRTRLGLFGNGSFQHNINPLGFCPDFFLAEFTLLQDVDGSSSRIRAVGFLSGAQVILQLFTLLTVEVVVLLQIQVCILHFLLVGSIGFGTGNDASAEFQQTVPYSHEFIDIATLLQGIQLAEVILHEALLRQYILEEFTLCVEHALCEVGIRSCIVGIAVNLAGIVNTCIRWEREGDFLFFNFLIPYDLSLVTVQQIAELTALDILCGNLDCVVLMRTELVDEVAVGAGDISRITGKCVGVALTGIHLDDAGKGAVGQD